MLVHNINAIKNLFGKPTNAAFLKFSLSGLALVSLLAVAIFSFFGCASDIRNQAPETSAVDMSQFKPVASGKSMVYIKPDKTVGVGKLLTFSIAATDPDGGWLDYSASNLPDGSNFDPDTLTFSWTPRYDQAGMYSVHFEVTDGEYTDSEDIIITVVQEFEDWDVNGDGAANVLDMVLVGQCWGDTGPTGWVREDTNEDGIVDVLDIIVIGQGWTG